MAYVLIAVFLPSMHSSPSVASPRSRSLYSDGKGQTRTERLHYTERTKFEIQNAVKAALKDSKDWHDFRRKTREN